MKGLIPVLLIISVLVISGCTAPSAPSAPSDGGAAPTGEPTTVQGIDQGISGVDDISTDLDISDMDNLESDLSDITW